MDERSLCSEANLAIIVVTLAQVFPVGVGVAIVNKVS